MKKRDELEEGFSKLGVPGGGAQNFGDAGTTTAIGLLGKAVIRLDRTSTLLAKVNIGLTVVILLVGIVQVILMLRGK